MPRHHKPPAHVHHKPTNQGRVRIAGHDYYTGPWGSATSRARYKQLIRDVWAAHQPADPAPARPRSIHTVADLVAAFLADEEIQRRHRPSREYYHFGVSFRPLLVVHGATPIRQFGPRALREVRKRMVADGLARRTVNQRIGRIKRAFQWAAADELIPESVYTSLLALRGLRAGDGIAPETEPRSPVPQELVERVIPFLSRTVAAMVRIQQLTGCRPGAVCRLRADEIDRTGPVWTFAPPRPGRKRTVVYLGPRAQEILWPFLGLPGYCFSPARVWAEYLLLRHWRRKSRVQPSQVSRARPDAIRRPRDHYRVDSYCHAVAKACERAGVTPFSPHQLRHTAATEFRRVYGLEVAQILLGHAKADVTQVYAQRDLRRAIEVMREIG